MHSAIPDTQSDDRGD